jgi:hypothetical protein
MSGAQRSEIQACCSFSIAEPESESADGLSKASGAKSPSSKSMSIADMMLICPMPSRDAIDIDQRVRAISPGRFQNSGFFVRSDLGDNGNELRICRLRKWFENLLFWD